MTAKKITTPIIYFLSVILITSLLISCGKDEKKPETKKEKEKKDDTTKMKTNTPPTTGGSPGKQLFYAKSSQNNIACADCHGDGTNSANPLTKYFSNIQGANKKASTYNGLFTGEEVVKHAGGATVCWESYERMKEPLTPDQINSLNEYYGSVAANAPAEIKYESVAVPKKDKAKLKDIQTTILALKGNDVKGELTFKTACGTCHGENATVKKVPGILEEFEGNPKSIVFNVRLGDGAMPFFHSPQLTDQDIADIAAYVMKKNGK